MTGFSDPIIGGAGTLIREAIQSPDYSTGVAGWRIGRDGTVEFNDGVFRGDLEAATITGGAITGATITAGTITGAAVSAGTITGTTITGATVSAGTITGTTITGATVSAGTITGATITAGTITGAAVSAGTITGTTITGGSIAGTTITGGTITGATLRTAASGARVEIGFAGVNFVSWPHGGSPSIADAYVTSQKIPGAGVMAIVGPQTNAAPAASVALRQNDGTGATEITLTAANTTVSGSVGVVGNVNMNGTLTFDRMTKDLVSGFGAGTFVAGSWYGITAPQSWGPIDDVGAWLVMVKIRDSALTHQISTGCGLISPSWWMNDPGGRQIVSIPMDRHNVGAPLNIDVSAAVTFTSGPRVLEVRPSATFTVGAGGAFQVELVRLA